LIRRSSSSSISWRVARVAKLIDRLGRHRAECFVGHPETIRCPAADSISGAASTPGALPFPLADLPRYRTQLCDYCFYGRRAGRAARVAVTVSGREIVATSSVGARPDRGCAVSRRSGSSMG
jgi:hypothetical protein